MPLQQATLIAPLARLIEFARRPLVISQVLASVTGGLSVVIGAVVLAPSAFTTFALLNLMGNLCLGVARSAVFQPALIQMRLKRDSFVPPYVALVTCVVIASLSTCLAPTSGVSSWGAALVVGVATAMPIAQDWLRARAVGLDQRWLVAAGEAVRVVLVPLALLPHLVPRDAVSMQVYFSAISLPAFLLLAIVGKRPEVFARYASYARAAAWQLGDYAVGQFVIAVPLLVLGRSAEDGAVSGIRLAQVILGPLSLIFMASVANLVADAATRAEFHDSADLIRSGNRTARTITINALILVCLATALVAVTQVDSKGVANGDIVFGMFLVGVYTSLSGWSGIQAILLRLLQYQAMVTLGRVIIVVVTITGFVVGYLVDGADSSLIAGFATATVASVLVYGILSRVIYRRVLGEHDSPRENVH